MEGIELLGEIGPRGLAVELEAFGGLTPDQKQEVLVRLRALHAYCEMTKPTSREAERLAEGIGMKRTNFMRLLERVREHGPVDGLVRNRHVKKRSSASRDGYPAHVETALAAVLGDDPTATLGEVVQRLARRLPLSDMPHPSSLRRRLSEVRQAGATGPVAEAMMRRPAVFGRALFAGTALSNIFVQDASGSGTERFQACHLGLIVDVDTRLVIGAGLSPSRDEAMGGAAFDLDTLGRRMIVGEVPIIRDVPGASITELTMERTAEGDEGADAGRTDAVGDAVGRFRVDRRSHVLFRVVGTRLGRIVLFPDTRDREKSRFELSLPEAKAFVRRDIERWNYVMLCARAGVRPEAGRNVIRSRLERWNSRSEPPFDSFDLLMHGLPGGRAASDAAVHSD